MCAKQAVWKPLVNAFATMCGLVVPIALAHAGCIIFQFAHAACDFTAVVIGNCSCVSSRKVGRRSQKENKENKKRLYEVTEYEFCHRDTSEILHK